MANTIPTIEIIFQYNSQYNSDQFQISEYTRSNMLLELFRTTIISNNHFHTVIWCVSVQTLSYYFITLGHIVISKSGCGTDLFFYHNTQEGLIRLRPIQYICQMWPNDLIRLDPEKVEDLIMIKQFRSRWWGSSLSGLCTAGGRGPDLLLLLES